MECLLYIVFGFVCIFLEIGKIRGILCMWKMGMLLYEEFENDFFDFFERVRKVGDLWNV